MNHDKILQHFTKDVGLIEKIFGKSSDILYNFEFEKAKQRLSTVYHKEDVDEIYPSVLDEEKMHRVLDVIFRVPQMGGGGYSQEEKEKFLGMF